MARIQRTVRSSCSTLELLDCRAPGGGPPRTAGDVSPIDRADRGHADPASRRHPPSAPNAGRSTAAGLRTEDRRLAPGLVQDTRRRRRAVASARPQLNRSLSRVGRSRLGACGPRHSCGRGGLRTPRPPARLGSEQGLAKRLLRADGGLTARVIWRLGGGRDAVRVSETFCVGSAAQNMARADGIRMVEAAGPCAPTREARSCSTAGRRAERAPERRSRGSSDPRRAGQGGVGYASVVSADRDTTYFGLWTRTSVNGFGSGVVVQKPSRSS